MFDIKILEEKKVICVLTGGFIKREEGIEIIEKLKQTFQRINTSKYYFILNSNEYKAVTQDNTNLLKEVINLYATTPFIKKFIIMSKSVIAKLQAQKNDTTDLPNSIIQVNSFDEAMSMIY